MGPANRTDAHVAGSAAGPPLAASTGSVAIALSLLFFALLLRSASAPPPRGLDAAPELFSSARAAVQIQRLLEENVPHPAGSAANRRVKQRIVTRLADLGLEIALQSALGCLPSHATCAFAENVLARLEGREKLPAVLLMAHYDSVEASAGAGDDAAGVAALLEIARILSREPPLRRPVVFAFTDAEEKGLLGAEAFFGQHAWAQQIDVVLNVEGAGSDGPSRLLRTAGENRRLIDSFSRVAPHPVASSLTSAIFEVMPNDTDFSVSLRAGLPGADFAFAGERNHYHTPLDNLDNLSRATLQHHGDNLLPLVRSLADRKPGETAADSVAYIALPGAIWLQWGEGAVPLLTLLCVVVAALAARRLVRMGLSTPRKLMLGVLAGAGSWFFIVVLGSLLFAFLHWSNGTTVAWPAQLWPQRLVLAGWLLLGSSLLARFWGRRLDFDAALLGGCTVWLAPALGSAVWMPGASSLALPVLGLASSALLLSTLPWLQRWPRRREVLGTLILLGGVPSTLMISADLEVTQGYVFVSAFLASLALYAVILIPLLPAFGPCAGKRAHALLSVSALMLAVGMIAAVSLPQFSAQRPQHLNILHVQHVPRAEADADRARAEWMLVSPNPVPERLAQLLDFAPAKPEVAPWAPLMAIQFFFGVDEHPRADAPTTSAQAPELRLRNSSKADGLRSLNLQFASPRGASYAMVLIPEAAGLVSLSIEGQPQPTTTPDGLKGFWGRHHALIVHALAPRGFELQLTLREPGPVEFVVLDGSPRLPPQAAPLLEARGELGVPVHAGDQSVVITRVRL